jgi:hypothetical protein
MITNPIEVRESDTVFNDSPEAGAPACLCSRCGKPIAADPAPIRVFNKMPGRPLRERRYHPACLGLIVRPMRPSVAPAQTDQPAD